MTIHKDFADWYRAASVTPTVELLEARWTGVAAVAADLDATKLVTLLRLAAVRPPTGFKAPEFLDAAFRSADPTFPNRDHVVELRVLAGAIVRQVVESGGQLATSAALGLVASSFSSRSETIIAADHVAVALEFLAQRGSVVRESPSSLEAKTRPMPKERLDEISQAFANNQVPNLRDPIINAFNDQTIRSNQELTRLSNSILRIVQAQREELNMLWWLQTKVSRDLGLPFADLGIQAFIVLSKELADLTVFLPGPPAMFGLLLAAMELAKIDEHSVTVASAINATTREWRERVVANAASTLGDLCPVSLAIARSLDTDGGAEWLPVYRKQCDVNIELEIPGMALASQLYTESLFSKSLSGVAK